MLTLGYKNCLKFKIAFSYDAHQGRKRQITLDLGTLQLEMCEYNFYYW